MTGEESKDKKKVGTGTKIKTGIEKVLVKIGGKLIIFASFIIIFVLLFLAIAFISISHKYVNEMDGVCIEANEFGSSSKVIHATAQSEDDFILKQKPKYEEVTEKIRLTDLKLTLNNNEPIIINISGKWLPWRVNSGFKKPDESFICMLEKANLPVGKRYSSKGEENEFYYIKNYYNSFIVNKVGKEETKNNDENKEETKNNDEKTETFSEIKVFGVAEAPERQKNCWVTRGAGLYLGMFGTTGRIQPTAYHHLIASKMLCAKNYWFGKNINDNNNYVITKYYEPSSESNKKSKQLRLNKIDGSLRTLFSQEEGGYTRDSEYFKLLEYKKTNEDYAEDLKNNYKSILEDNTQKTLNEISNGGIDNEEYKKIINDFKNKINEIKNFITKLREDYKCSNEKLSKNICAVEEIDQIPVLNSETMEKEFYNNDLKRILTKETECEISPKKDENGNDMKDDKGNIIRECEEEKICCDIRYNEDLKELEYFSGDGTIKEVIIKNDIVSASIFLIDKLNQIIEAIDKDIEFMESNEAKIEYKENANSQKLNFVEKEYTLADFKKDYFSLESYNISSGVGTESSKILTINGNQIVYDIDLHEKLLYNLQRTGIYKTMNPAAIVADSISMFDKACYFIDKDEKGDTIRKNRSYFQFGPKNLYKHFSETNDIEYEYGERIKMLIVDKYYSDNDGFYNIEIISGINFDDSGTIASKLKEVEFYFLGTPIPGSEEDRTDGIIAKIFNNLLNTGFAQFARAVMVLYVTLFGFRVIFGFKKNNRDNSPIKMSDLMIDLAKMVMIITIISPSGFLFFNRVILNFTINGVIGIVDMLANIFSSSFMSEENFMALSGGLAKANETLSLAKNFKVLDEVLALFKTDSIMLKIFSLFYNFKTDFFAGIPVGFGMLIILLLYLFKLFKVVIPFFFTLLQMTLVLPLAPLFMLFNFFEQTQYLFKNWMKFVLQKCLEIIAFFTAFYFMTFIINDFIRKLLSFKVCFGKLGDHICKTAWNGECGGIHFVRKIIVSAFNSIIYMEKESMPNGKESFFKYYITNILICLVLLILFEEITKMISDIIGSVLVIGDAKASDLGGNATISDFGAENQDGSSKFGLGNQLKQFSNTMGFSEMQKSADALKWTRPFVDLSKNPMENLKDLTKKAYNIYSAGGEARIEAMQERIDDKVQDNLREKDKNEEGSNEEESSLISKKWSNFKKRREKYHNSVRDKKREKRKQIMEKDFKEFNDSFGKDSMFDLMGVVRGDYKRFWSTEHKGKNKFTNAFAKAGNAISKKQNKVTSWLISKPIDRLKDKVLRINKKEVKLLKTEELERIVEAKQTLTKNGKGDLLKEVEGIENILKVEGVEDILKVEGVEDILKVEGLKDIIDVKGVTDIIKSDKVEKDEKIKALKDIIKEKDKLSSKDKKDGKTLEDMAREKLEKFDEKTIDEDSKSENKKEKDKKGKNGKDDKKDKKDKNKSKKKKKDDDENEKSEERDKKLTKDDKKDDKKEDKTSTAKEDENKKDELTKDEKKEKENKNNKEGNKEEKTEAKKNEEKRDKKEFKEEGKKEFEEDKNTDKTGATKEDKKKEEESKTKAEESKKDVEERDKKEFKEEGKKEFEEDKNTDKTGATKEDKKNKSEESKSETKENKSENKEKDKPEETKEEKIEAKAEKEEAERKVEPKKEEELEAKTEKSEKAENKKFEKKEEESKENKSEEPENKESEKKEEAERKVEPKEEKEPEKTENKKEENNSTEEIKSEEPKKEEELEAKTEETENKESENKEETKKDNGSTNIFNAGNSKIILNIGKNGEDPNNIFNAGDSENVLSISKNGEDPNNIFNSDISEDSEKEKNREEQAKKEKQEKLEKKKEKDKKMEEEIKKLDEEKKKK